MLAGAAVRWSGVELPSFLLRTSAHRTAVLAVVSAEMKPHLRMQDLEVTGDQGT